jgi:hypothetical protein
VAEVDQVVALAAVQVVVQAVVQAVGLVADPAAADRTRIKL